LVTPFHFHGHPIYNVRNDLDAHVQVLQKAIEANGERNDLNIVNIFCFTLRDAILEWAEIFMQSHLKCTFAKLEATFCKRYWKVQTYKHVYMALRIIKQTLDEKMEVYYERILKLVNYLNHKTNDSMLTTLF
jgi:hypothetical protein